MGLTLRGRLGTAALFLVLGAAWCAVIHSWATRPRGSPPDEMAAGCATLALVAWTAYVATNRARDWSLPAGIVLSGLTGLCLVARFLPVPPAYKAPAPPPDPYREAVRVGGRPMSVDVYRMYDPEAECYVYFTGPGGAMAAYPARKEKGQP